MKLLSVDAAGGMWGSERALLDVLNTMPGKHEAAVCCPPGTALEVRLREAGIRVFPTYIENLHLKSVAHRLLAAWNLLLVCIRYKPDVIHLNQAGALGVAAVATKLLRIPIVAHVRIFEDVPYLAERGTGNSALSGLIAISHAVARELDEYQELSSIPRVTIYDAYQESEVSTTNKNSGQIACVGRITPVKGQDVLVEALASMQQPEKVKCVVLGAGETGWLAELKGKSDDRIEWVGFQEAVMPFLAESEILVCPSHREPLGRVIFEAWNAGCLPIVFAGSGGAAEIVTASEGGLTYNEQTGESLAAVIEHAMRMTDQQRMAFVENGKRWMTLNTEPQKYSRSFFYFLQTLARE